MKKRDALWMRANKLIPGGNHLLSKHPDLYMPEVWPQYFSLAKGCRVVTPDNETFYDYGLMGVGTSVLGYADDVIDAQVIKAIRNGIVSSLNCAEEIELAELLIDMHPWASMVRFARTGGEACSIAIRACRAFTGRERVLIGGYHGWHDWYLSANLDNRSNLDNLLIEGLSPLGVPKSLVGTCAPFDFNNLESLNIQLRKENVAAVILEVARTNYPDIKALAEVKSLCRKYGTQLIFDECTSGFRESMGGLHLDAGVSPDVCLYGKALGNGYAITAIVGREKVMSKLGESFVSSTFWSERIGFVAGVATINQMKAIDSPSKVKEFGIKIKALWSHIADKHGIAIKVGGLTSLPCFTFLEFDHIKARVFISSKMLSKGFLALDRIYLSLAHDSKIYENYAEALDESFGCLSMSSPSDLELEDRFYPKNRFQRLNEAR